MDAAAADAGDTGASPLSQLPHVDEKLLSAMPGESDRKFLNSLSQRKKRKDRRRLHEMQLGPAEAAAAAASQSAVDGLAGVSSATATAAAAPLLVVAASPTGPVEDEEVVEDGTLPPPPPDFGEGVDQQQQQEAAELVQDQMDALPAMVAHMEGRRLERQNLQYRMRTIAAKVPAGKRSRQLAQRLWSGFVDLLGRAFDAFTLGLYRTSFGKIEGNFGAGCASYFSFIRWLFMFNLALSCVVFGCCVFPYLIIQRDLTFEKTVPPEIASGPAGQAYPDMLKAVQCSRLVQEKIANISDHDAWASVADAFTGGGWMLKLPVFLGSYFNKSTAAYDANATSESGGLTYNEHFNTPVAMLLCLIVLIACGLGAALSTSNSLYRKILKVSVRGSKSSKLSIELFSAWDYGLRAQKAARMRHRTVAMRLRSLVLHLQLKARSRSPGTLVARVLANTATIGLYCAAAYLIFFAIDSQSRLNRLRDHHRRYSPTIRVLIDLMPQLTISLINIIIPLVLGKLIAFEYYSASVEILVQLGRVVFLKLLSFVTLIVTIGVVLWCPEAERDACDNCQSLETLCWETYIGQQLYRTMIIDIVMSLIVTPLLTVLRWALNVKVGGRVCSKVPQAELLISNDVLELVYRQSICFVGAFFCPYLLPIACLSYGCLFHIRRFTLRFMLVSNKSYRASLLERFFLDVLLLFLFVLLVPLTICLMHFHPSRGCGPYRVYQTANSDYHMVSTLTNWVLWSGTDRFRGLLKLAYTYTVLNPTVHLLTLLLLLVFTYFFYSVVKARDTLIEFLERKLQSESKIKLELASRELQLLKMRQ